MKGFLVISLFLFLSTKAIIGSPQYQEDPEDNEFAEFEDFEEDDLKGLPDSEKTQSKSPDKNLHQSSDDSFDTDGDVEVIVEDEDNEFEHFQDEEEFEGFVSEKTSQGSKVDEKEAPKITITKVPLHFRSNWDSFYLEMLMVTGLVVYFINFFTGKAKNSKMANVWYSTHKSLLEENFSLVGDDGKIEIESRSLTKESEHLYTLWCSGRTCCEGMLVELKFIKRQDLVAVIGQMMRPTMDQIHIRVDMSKDDMDSFVFCVAAKKTATRLAKEMADLSVYAPDRRPGDKLSLPASLSVMSEMGEVATALLDSKMVSFLNKNAHLVDYIHFSDQFSGPKQQEETNVTKLPPTKKVLLFGFNIPTKGKTVQEAMDAIKPVMGLVFYSMEKVKRLRLSKEGKNKADKNRSRVEEAFLKTTHVARAEAAAARREEKRRQEKERILQEDDPEKQRKWEEKEMKRQLKKKAPKMKQLKVKAL